MAWCLIKQYADAFRKALRDGTIDPVKMAEMTSLQRREFLAKYVGNENAQNVNALFESKLLLKNQQAGMIAWAKKVAGITPQKRSDLITRIERMERVLDPAEGEQFLNDLASARLKIEVTQEEAKNIMDLSREITKAKESADQNGIFPSEEMRLKYGAAKVAMENYINDLKLASQKITFKEAPVRKAMQLLMDIPSAAKSLKSSFDNSFWGRQGLPVLLNIRTSDIWVKNFMKSWTDIAKELKGQDAINAVKADIYSRPNAINGKYKAGGYGLDVLSEEAYPSALPEKIPLLKRLYRASQSAYNGAALRLRADLADRFIAKAEGQGINMLDPEQARGVGHLVGAMTGRGSLGKAETLAKEINVILFSVKLLKSNFDKVTALQFDKQATPFAKAEAAKNLASTIFFVGAVMALANLFDDDMVDEDPRSTNFGRLKLFGHWVDITAGMAGLVTLASRLIPTVHDGEWGFWYKSGTGKWTRLSTGKYGEMTALDVFENFFEGKLAPVAAVVRDAWTGTDFDGNPLTVTGVAEDVTIPLPLENFNQLRKDPETSFLLGSVLLDMLGFSTSTSIVTNESSKAIPVGSTVNNGDIISYVHTYATALNVDPETAFNRIFTGQKIVRVTGNTVVVERLPVSESQEIKEKAGAKNPTMKLDHTIPLQLGGSNDISNLKLVTTSKWTSYTAVENALGKALKAGKITKKEAQDLIIKFKNEDLTKEQVLKRID